MDFAPVSESLVLPESEKGTATFIDAYTRAGKIVQVIEYTPELKGKKANKKGCTGEGPGRPAFREQVAQTKAG